MKGARSARSVAAAVLACAVLAACGATPPLTPARATPAPTPQVRADVTRLIDALIGKGFVCGASAFYPASPGLRICAAVSGAFDQRVDVVGPASNGINLSATLYGRTSGTHASADLVRSTYGPIMTGLFQGRAATTASRWLSEHAEGGGEMHLGPYVVALEPPDQLDARLSIVRLPPVFAGTPSALPTDAPAVRRYAEEQGATSCAPSGEIFDCEKRASGERTQISASAPIGPSSGNGPDAVGSVDVSISGPSAPPATYSAQIGGLVKDLVRQELPGQPADADRAVDWISSQNDGAAHGMVFDGLEVVVTVLGESRPSAIESEDLQIRPANV